MTEHEIQHFLLIYRVPEGHAEVMPFGDDYDAALVAYNEAEEEHRGEDDVEVVLFGSDSLATLERTHSSYSSCPRSTSTRSLRATWPSSA